MSQPTKVYFARSALVSIKNETLTQPDLETGGLLVGRRIVRHNTPVLLVISASGPGEKPERSVAQYAPDHQTLQQWLEMTRDNLERYEVDYIGEWHKHPQCLPYLSSGDIAQARAIFRDPDYHLSTGDLLLPITRSVQGRFWLGVFYMSQQAVGELVRLSYTEIADEVVLQYLDEYLTHSESCKSS